MCVCTSCASRRQRQSNQSEKQTQRERERKDCSEESQVHLNPSTCRYIGVARDGSGGRRGKGQKEQKKVCAGEVRPFVQQNHTDTPIREREKHAGLCGGAYWRRLPKRATTGPNEDKEAESEAPKLEQATSASAQVFEAQAPKKEVQKKAKIAEPSGSRLVPQLHTLQLQHRWV